jgi:hypothetical protein
MVNSAITYYVMCLDDDDCLVLARQEPFTDVAEALIYKASVNSKCKPFVVRKLGD